MWNPNGNRTFSNGSGQNLNLSYDVNLQFLLETVTYYITYILKIKFAKYQGMDAVLRRARLRDDDIPW